VERRAVERQRLVMTGESGPARRVPQLLTLAVCAVLVGLAGVFALRAGNQPLLATSLWWAPVAMAAMFVGAEARYVTVEFRRQAYSFTLSGIPLVLGLLVCPPWQVVVARVAGAAAMLLVQRVPPLKVAYNLAAFAFETALVGWLVHLLLPERTVLTLTRATILYLVVLVVDAAMTALVLGMIRLHGGAAPRNEIGEAVLSAGAFNAVSLAYALVVAVLVTDGPLGFALLMALSAVAVSGYRAYTVLSARHHALEQVSDFVSEPASAESIEALAAQRIARIRTLLRAARVQALLADPASERYLLLASDDASGLTTSVVRVHDVDWLSTRVMKQDDVVLVPRATKDLGLRRWLADQQASDAIVVPLVHGDRLYGSLAVLDRLGDHATFTRDDVTMLRTLAGHLGMTLRNNRLLQKLRRDATHDVLTGLANRALLQERLDASLADSRRAQLAVLLMDLDRFKEVNDALGHEVGDRLLKVVGQRLLETSPHGTTVCRLGGDEFAVLVPAAIGEDPALLGEKVAQELVAAVNTAVELDDVTLSVEASIGVATTAYAATASDLLRHADTAMYAAKTSGGGVHRYGPELDRGRAERLALVADLRLALDREELFLLYQPQVDLRSGRITGVEALVRWQHPRLGTLSPDTFIPLAESTGLIEPLTRLVLRSAVHACRRWLDGGLQLTVAVNLSARCVSNSALAAIVAAALDEAGLPAGVLVLEITESAVMADPDAAVPTLRRLVEAGIKLSLDDFGTGYSSLAYLQRLPIQELKIDRSFVRGLTGAPADQRASETLIRSIVGLAKALDLRVVAEGVEHAEAVGRLESLGVDCAQGFHLGLPESADHILALARQESACQPLPGASVRAVTHFHDALVGDVA
jgi:diguanylate cyclase (GGDEF)-like protein